MLNEVADLPACPQEHALQGGRMWSQAASFSLTDLQASLAQACTLAASQASVPWEAVQDIVASTSYGAGLSQADRQLLRTLAAQVLDEAAMRGAVQRASQQSGLPLGSTLEACRCATCHARASCLQCRLPERLA